MPYQRLIGEIKMYLQGRIRDRLRKEEEEEEE